MKKHFLLSCFLTFIAWSATWAQLTVTGTVTGEENEPLIGVNIVEVGNISNGTVTDIDGKYSIQVSSSSASLEFSYTGFTNRIIPVSGRETIDVTMEVGVALDEVVVTALGISREKRKLTYATQSVNTEELSQARDLNVVNSLSGKVAGISVSRSGSGVGSASRVILRGNRSISGSSEPLYVVDGVPILGDPTDINPDDIESVSVLKGPNAAALYGNRANNGAIIITTKAGQQGFRVTLNSTFMAELPIIFKDYQNQFGQGNNGQYSPSSEDSWGAPLNGTSVPHWSPDPNFPVSTYPYEAQPDNVRDFFQTGHTFANSLAISTGNDKNLTYFSYTFTDAAGVVPNNELQRHNVHVRVRNELATRLTLDTKLNYVREDIDNQLSQGESFSNPTRHALRLPRNIRTEDIEKFEYVTETGRVRQHYWNPGSNGGANPYWAINRNLDEDVVDRVIAFASLRYQITDFLSVQVRSAMDRINRASDTRYFNDSYIIADDGLFSQTKSDDLEWNNDILLSYDQDLNSDISLSVSVGANARRERGSSLTGRIDRGTGLIVPNFFTLGNASDNIASSDFGAPRDVNSVYGFATIGFKNAIFLDVTGRNDWSSTLPPDNWSFFYPSVGLSFDLTELVTLPTFFTFAKVRGSWAQVGNDTSPFQLSRTASLSGEGRNGFLTLSSTLPNENLLPEETTSLEIGADLRFLRNRIGLDFSWYKSNSRDQLFTVALPVGSGASQFFTNGGDVQNSGIEAILNLTPVKFSDFSWDLTFNFTANDSEVLEINDERPRIQVASDFLRAFFIEQGQPFGNVYSRGFQRDAQGRIIVGTNGLPLITPGRTVLVANYNPDWLGGIRNSFRYKGLNVSFLIDIRQGGSTTSITDAIVFGGGHVVETLEGRGGTLVFGRDIFEDETAVLEDGTPNNLTTSAEAFWNLVGGRNAPVGEAFSRDASNMRLRELVAGYRLPLENSPVRAVTLSFVGRNLFFFYNKAETLDPESIVGTAKQAEGFESFAPPTARSMGVNLKLEF